MDGFSGYDDDVREYGYGPEDETREHGYASPGSEDGPRRDYGQAPKAKNPILAFLAVLGVKLRTAQAAGEAVTLEDEEELGEELPAKKAAKKKTAKKAAAKKAPAKKGEESEAPAAEQPAAEVAESKE